MNKKSILIKPAIESIQVPENRLDLILEKVFFEAAVYDYMDNIPLNGKSCSIYVPQKKEN